MPPKVKLHNKHGKTKNFPTKYVPPTVTPSVPSQHQSSETEAAGTPGGSRDDQVAALDAQFELELCWCIQELEISLQDKKINPKQAQESLGVLKVLRNKTQPTVRKRQLMRMHFGDYRAKMAKEEKQAQKTNSQISFSTPSTSGEKSTYIRKSFAQSLGDNSFKFNFQSSKEDECKKTQEIENTSSTVEINTAPIIEKPILNTGKFLFSNSEFKFNFNVENNMS